MSPARKSIPGVRESVRKQIDKLDFEMLLCRDIGHEWKPDHVKPEIWQGLAVRLQSLICERCSSEKDKWRDPYTGYSHSRMRYSLAYLITDSGFLTIEERAYISAAWMDQFSN